MTSQHIFHDSDLNEYFLIDIYENTIDGMIVTLKIKRNGWSDVWSLPLEKIKETIYE